MIVFDVGAGYKIGHVHHGIVGDDAGFNIHRSGKSPRSACSLHNHFVVGQFQFIGSQIIFYLNLVDFLVAANQHCAGLAVGVKD